jgi:hypothetical protein
MHPVDLEIIEQRGLGTAAEVIELAEAWYGESLALEALRRLDPLTPVRFVIRQAGTRRDLVLVDIGHPPRGEHVPKHRNSSTE